MWICGDLSTCSFFFHWLRSALHFSTTPVWNFHFHCWQVCVGECDTGRRSTFYTCFYICWCLVKVTTTSVTHWLVQTKTTQKASDLQEQLDVNWSEEPLMSTTGLISSMNGLLEQQLVAGLAIWPHAGFSQWSLKVLQQKNSHGPKTYFSHREQYKEKQLTGKPWPKKIDS